MYRFVSSKNPIALKNDYLKQYNVRLLQKKLGELMKKHTEIAKALPKDLSAKKLLIGRFEYLTKVYCAFTRATKTKSDTEKKTLLKEFVRGGFNYESHRSKIANFLIDSTHGFEIHNCIYCDLQDVAPFINSKGKKVRRFETEHVLDKGECPLVALSLFNFVPSCDTCNSPDIKGTKTIGDNEYEIAKLSPTVEGYDFSSQVRFEIKYLNPYAADLKPLSHQSDYEIDFNIKKPIYQKSIDLFELKARYNQDPVLTELLKWRDFRRQNPDNIVQIYANNRKIPFNEMFEEMFQVKLRMKKHYPMEKARREVMLMF